jgi:hypothetical protein
LFIDHYNFQRTHERVILTGPEGARREVDLSTAGVMAGPALPEPVCPAGRVGNSLEDDVAAPGASVLDEVVPPGTMTQPPPSVGGGA